MEVTTWMTDSHHPVFTATIKRMPGLREVEGSVRLHWWTTEWDFRLLFSFPQGLSYYQGKQGPEYPEEQEESSVHWKMSPLHRFVISIHIHIASTVVNET